MTTGAEMERLKGFMEQGADGELLVGARSAKSDYLGPVARVSAQGQWLYIITDEYEGCAMLNIEALPYLRKALAALSKAQP